MLDGLGFVGESVAAATLVSLTVYTSYVLAWRFVSDPDAMPLRWCAAAMIGMWLATVGFHLLFSISAFKLPVALPTVLLLAYAARRSIGTSSVMALLTSDTAILAAKVREPNNHPLRVSWFFLPFVVFALARCLILPPLGWDWMSYHGVRAAIFLQNESWTFPEASGILGLCRHYFAGSEVLAAWAMLPFHSDLLVNLVFVVQWICLGFAVVTLAGLLRLGATAQLISGFAVMFIPAVRTIAAGGYVDVGQSLAVISAACFVIAFSRSPTSGYALLAFVATGIAIGIKLSAAAPSVVIVASVVCICLFSRRHRRQTAKWVIPVGFVVMLLPCLPWLSIAYRDTGYPLSPMAIEVFGLTLGVTNPEMERLQQTRSVSSAEWDTLRILFGSGRSSASAGTQAWVSPPALGQLTLLPLCVLPFGLIAGWKGRLRREILILLGLMLAVAIFYYHPGVEAVRKDYSASSARYVLAIPAIGIPISFIAAVRWGFLMGPYSVALFATSAFHAASYALHGVAAFEVRYIVYLVAFGGATIVAMSLLSRVNVKVRIAAVAILALAGALGLRSVRHDLRERALQRSVHVHSVPRYWHDAARLVDHGPGRLIAVTGGPTPVAGSWFTYFFLGRKLQNRITYVPITDDGRALLVGPGIDRRDFGNRAAWSRRIVESGATEVLSFAPLSLEQAWMEADPERFEKLAGTTSWGLFRVRDARAAPERAMRSRRPLSPAGSRTRIGGRS